MSSQRNTSHPLDPSIPKTYYNLLGIESSATEQQVRRAWLQKSLETHPDRNPDDHSASNLFQSTKEAYETLSDESKRAQYDHFLSTGISHNPESPPGGYGFGYGFAFERPMRGNGFSWGGVGTGGNGWMSGLHSHQAWTSGGREGERDRDGGNGENRGFGTNGFGQSFSTIHPFGMGPGFGFSFGFPYPHSHSNFHSMGGLAPGMGMGSGIGMGKGYHPMHHRGSGLGNQFTRGPNWVRHSMDMRPGPTHDDRLPSSGVQEEDVEECEDDQPRHGGRRFPPPPPPLPPVYGMGGHGPGMPYPQRGGMHSIHSFPPGSNGQIPPRTSFQGPSFSPPFQSTPLPSISSRPRPPPLTSPFGPGLGSRPIPQRTFSSSSRGTPHPHAFPPRPSRMPFRPPPVNPAEIALQNALMMLVQTNAINLQTQMMVGHLLRERYGFQGAAAGGEAPMRAEAAEGSSGNRKGSPQDTSTPARGPTLLISNKRHSEGTDITMDVADSPPKKSRRGGASTSLRDDPSLINGDVEEQQSRSGTTASDEGFACPADHTLAITTTEHNATEDERVETSSGQTLDPSLDNHKPLEESTQAVDTQPALDRLLDVLGLSSGQFVSLAQAGRMEDYLATRRDVDAGELQVLLASNMSGVIDGGHSGEGMSSAGQNVVMS